MDFTKEILNMFQQGDSIEDIAQLITKSLNDANAAYQEEQRKIDAIRTSKINRVKNILSEICGLMTLYDMDAATIEALRDADVEGIVDSLDEEIPKLQELFAALEQIGCTSFPIKEEKNVKENKNKVDSIEEFLNKYVRV